jgi:hypothetical protein
MLRDATLAMSCTGMRSVEPHIPDATIFDDRQ